MKELYLNNFEDAAVCAGKLIDCLHNLKELTLRWRISPEMKSKLKTRGDDVGCKVTFINET